MRLRQYLSGAKDRLFDQKNIDAARFALQSAVAAAAAFAVVNATGLGEAYISVISAVFVVQPSVGGTANTGWNRLFATLLGTGIGFFLLYILPTDWGTVAALAIAMFVVNAIAAFRIDWRYGAIPAAAMALGSATETWQTALDRGIAIGLGVLIGLVISLILWPDTASRRVQRQIRGAIEASATRLCEIARRIEANEEETENTAARKRFHGNISDARETAERLAGKARRRTGSVIDAIEDLYNSVLVINRTVRRTEDSEIDDALRDAFDRIRQTGEPAIRSLVREDIDRDAAITAYEDCIRDVRDQLREAGLEGQAGERRAALIFGLNEVLRTLRGLSKALSESGEIKHGVIASTRRMVSEALPGRL